MRRRRSAVAAPAPAGRASGAHLRGLGWGVLALVILGVVVFASVLVAVGLRQGPLARAPALPGTDGPPRAAADAWAFDEGTGDTAADAAGQLTGYPLRLKDGAGWTAGMSGGTALLLDGARAYASSAGPVLDTAGSYTVAAWVRMDRIPRAFATAVSQDGTRRSAFFLQYSDTDKLWAFAAVRPDGTPSRALSNVPPVAGRWTYLVGVRDAQAGTLVLYLDGQKQGTAVYDEREASAGPLVVGRALAAGRLVDFFPGAVDSVAVYGSTLTAAQVSDLYRGGR